MSRFVVAGIDLHSPAVIRDDDDQQQQQRPAASTASPSSPAPSRARSKPKKNLREKLTKAHPKAAAAAKVNNDRKDRLRRDGMKARQGNRDRLVSRNRPGLQEDEG